MAGTRPGKLPLRRGTLPGGRLHVLRCDGAGSAVRVRACPGSGGAAVTLFDLPDDALTGMFLDVTRRRRAAGSYVSGRWVDGAETTATIRASVQPATPRQIDNLPEAVRTHDAVMIYCVPVVRTVDERTLLKADRIDWQGEQYEVHGAKSWAVGSLDHYEGIATRVERATP